MATRRRRLRTPSEDADFIGNFNETRRVRFLDDVDIEEDVDDDGSDHRDDERDVESGDDKTESQNIGTPDKREKSEEFRRNTSRPGRPFGQCASPVTVGESHALAKLILSKIKRDTGLRAGGYAIYREILSEFNEENKSPFDRKRTDQALLGIYLRRIKKNASAYASTYQDIEILKLGHYVQPMGTPRTIDKESPAAKTQIKTEKNTKVITGTEDKLKGSNETSDVGQNQDLETQNVGNREDNTTPQDELGESKSHTIAGSKGDIKVKVESTETTASVYEYENIPEGFAERMGYAVTAVQSVANSGGASAQIAKNMFDVFAVFSSYAENIFRK